MGGIHHDSYIICSIHTYLFFIIALVLSRKITIGVNFYFLFSFFGIIDACFVPIPSIKKGKYGRKSVRRMKMLSIIGLFISYMISVIVPNYQKIILVVLVLVHIEFLMQCLLTKRKEVKTCLM